MEYKICSKCNRNLIADRNNFHLSKKGKFGLTSECKVCSNNYHREHYRLIVLQKLKLNPKDPEGYRKCKGCKVLLPLTAEYFFRISALKSGFMYKCKRCKGYEYRKPRLLPKDGYKICTLCKRELPATTDYFHKRKNRKSGLKVRCKECNNNDVRKYFDTPQGKIVSRRSNIKNQHSESKKKGDLKYRKSEKGRITNRKSCRKYLKTKKGKEAKRRGDSKYRKTEKGKLSNRKRKAIRRKMKYIVLLNNPFPSDIKVEWHHINNLFVVPIPMKTHKFCHRGINSELHRKDCNEFIKKIYGLNIDKLLSDDW